MGDFARGLAGGLAGGLRPEVLVPALLQRKATRRAIAQQERQRKQMVSTVRSAFEGGLLDRRQALEIILNLGGTEDISWLTGARPTAERPPRRDIVERAARRLGRPTARIGRAAARGARAVGEVGREARAAAEVLRGRIPTFEEAQFPLVTSAEMAARALAGRPALPEAPGEPLREAAAVAAQRLGRPLGVAGRAVARLPGLAGRVAPVEAGPYGVQGWLGLSPARRAQIIEQQRMGRGLRREEVPVPWFIAPGGF